MDSKSKAGSQGVGDSHLSSLNGIVEWNLEEPTLAYWLVKTLLSPLQGILSQLT